MFVPETNQKCEDKKQELADLDVIPKLSYEDIERHCASLMTVGIDQLKALLTKADEDAIWIASLQLSSELLHAVFLPRLQQRIYAQGGLSLGSSSRAHFPRIAAASLGKSNSNSTNNSRRGSKDRKWDPSLGALEQRNSTPRNEWAEMSCEGDLTLVQLNSYPEQHSNPKTSDEPTDASDRPRPPTLPSIPIFNED